MILLFTTRPSEAKAVDTPVFPSCTNPQGTIKANYSSGTHGIVGNIGNFSGQDTVYQLDSNNVVQCFCPSNGQGVQTNWWKADQLSESDINILRNQGWSYIPNGALWGLDSSPYLAKNSDFSCQDVGSAGGFSSSGGQGSVLGVNSILGLASTGNNMLFHSLPLMGLLFLILGLVLRKRFSK